MLNATTIRNAKPKSKQYRLSDAHNLYLLVRPNGSKLWRLDYSLNGKRKTFSLGKFPTTDLKTARIKAEEARALIADCIDPVQYRQQEIAIQASVANNTFGVIANEWLGKQRDGWSLGHLRTVESRLTRDLSPWLDNRPIREIDPPELLRVIRRIESRGAGETAHRCKTICSQVFRYAIACGLADRDPAADLSGALTPTRPKKMAAITDPVKAGELMRAISGYQGDNLTRMALKISALTFCRPGEIRHMEWSEISWIKEQWAIPGEKMKMKRDHIVPLADQSLDALREIYPLTGKGKYVFPSLRSDMRPMSNNTVLAALRRMGFTKEEMTPHGFRSMASTLLHESGQFEHDDIELQLAHSVGSKVSQAYNRSKRLPERKKMMQWWSDYLDRLEHGEELDGLTGKGKHAK